MPLQSGALFGSDFTVDDLYGYLMKAKDLVPEQITEDVDALIAIASGDYGLIRYSATAWLKEDLKEAATGDYGKFRTKLSVIGWNFYKLIDAKDRISDEVDPGNAGEIALLKAYVRTETFFIKDGKKFADDIILGADGHLSLQLSVLGYEWAGDVLGWKTTTQNSNNRRWKSKAVNAGKTKLIAHKPGNRRSAWPPCLLCRWLAGG